MSDTIWVEIDDGEARPDDSRDCSIMLKLAERLDALAEQLGVDKLSSFYDYTALADAYSGEFEGDEVEPPSPMWFEADRGRQSVSALQAALRATPDLVNAALDASRSHWTTALLEDLEHCHSVLKKAERSGHRFHFLIVP